MVYTSHLRYIWGILGMALLTPAPRFSDPAIFKSLFDAHTTARLGGCGNRFPRKGRRSERLGGFNHRKISIWPPKPWKNLDLTLPGITRLDHQNFDPGWIEPQDLDFDSKRWGKTRDRNGWNGPTLWLSHLGNRESSSRHSISFNDR